MKIAHINKKDIEREQKLLEAGREAMRYQSKLVYKNCLKRMAKYEALQRANKKPGDRD